MGGDQTEVGRIAFRVEGDWWRGYWSPSRDNMNEAILLGEVRLSLAGVPQVKKAFIDLMTAAFAAAVKDVTGLTPTFGGPVKAPEAEKAKVDPHPTAPA